MYIKSKFPDSHPEAWSWAPGINQLVSGLGRCVYWPTSLSLPIAPLVPTSGLCLIPDQWRS